MKKWIEKEMRNLLPLEYIIFQNVPMRDSAHGPIIDVKPEVLEIKATKAIVENKIPLRGKEVQFIRKALGLSLEKFSNKLDLSSGTVFHWEKASDERLSIVNEIAVRSLIAELLNMDISGKFSDLVGTRLTDLRLSA